MVIQPVDVKKNNHRFFVTGITTASVIVAGLTGYTRNININKLKKETANDIYINSKLIPNGKFKSDKMQTLIQYLPSNIKEKVSSEIMSIKIKKAGIYAIGGLAIGMALSLFFHSILNIKSKSQNSNQDYLLTQKLLLMNVINNNSMSLARKI